VIRTATSHSVQAKLSVVEAKATGFPDVSIASERRQLRMTMGLFGLLIAAMILAPFAVYPIFIMKIMIFGIFASGVNLLLGYGGLLSFGHAAYFGIASYATGFAASRLGLSPELALLGGLAVSLVLGAAFGAIAVRRLGIYFSMITLALAQLIYFLAVQNPRITGGEDGLQPVPRGTLFGLFDLQDMYTLYIVTALITLASLLFVYRVTTSPFGRVLSAIRDNEARARTLGYSPARYKLLVFVISAGLAGLAGALKAIVMQVVTLADVHLMTSAEPILMILVGGIGSLFGPIIGSAVVVSMQYFLAPFGAWVTVCQGIIFILCVLAFKQGIVGLIRKLAARWM
jgi:branched-chain amino acid transport system permease protein